MLYPVFNVTGGEVIIIILAALVVLGPEKLPVMLKRAGKLYGELRRMSDGFQQEIRSALDEPTRELRDTMEMAKSSFTGVADAAKSMVRPDLSEGERTDKLEPAPDQPAAADPMAAAVMDEGERERLAAPALPPVRVPEAAPPAAFPAPTLAPPTAALPPPPPPPPPVMNGHAPATLPPPAFPAPLPPPDSTVDAS